MRTICAVRRCCTSTRESWSNPASRHG